MREIAVDTAGAVSTAAGEAVARDIGTYADKKAKDAKKLAASTDDPVQKAQYLQEAKACSEGEDSREEAKLFFNDCCQSP